jgi:hypothetical protein
MFLAKLCDILGTDIGGLHDSLLRIPEITKDKWKISKQIFDGVFTIDEVGYTMERENIVYRIVLKRPVVDNEIFLYAYRFGPEDERFQGYLPYEEAESNFLAIIAKRITRIKSARN